MGKTREKIRVERRGIGFFGLLTILFIALKLTGYINWSWWFVLLPLYGPITLLLVATGVCLLIAYAVS